MGFAVKADIKIVFIYHQAHAETIKVYEFNCAIVVKTFLFCLDCERNFHDCEREERHKKTQAKIESLYQSQCVELQEAYRK